MGFRHNSEYSVKANGVSKKRIRASSSLRPLAKLLQEGQFNTSHGGTIDVPRPLELFIKKDGSSACTVKFPPDEEGEKRLLELCEPASFGKGSEEVLDPEYRQALRLNGDKFSMNFELQSTTLLEDIKAALCPDRDNVSLTAELDKLNVYTKGGFFKDHRDTPRGNNVIGTLVLVLPSAFEGGDLVVAGSGSEEQAAVFSWPEETKWDAFSLYQSTSTASLYCMRLYLAKSWSGRIELCFPACTISKWPEKLGFLIYTKGVNRHWAISSHAEMAAVAEMDFVVVKKRYHPLKS